MIALIDCNNFFVSCERLFRPDLIGKPVAVLSSNDGCVVARSNEVKDLGVPMGVPYFKVRDVFTEHNAHIFSSNFALYSTISQRIIHELRQFSPRVEIYSVDEAFLDLSQLHITDYQKWGQALKRKIEKHIGMPVSVGIAPSKTLAKLASEYTKRAEGVCFLDPSVDGNFYKKVLEKTTVGGIWGVGSQYTKRFQAAGIQSAWQLSQTSKQWLGVQMGVLGERLHDELHGVLRYPVEEEKKPQKSIIASRSFGHRVKNQHELEIAVASFASQTAARLRSFSQTTGLFGVYLRYRDEEGKSQHQSAAVEIHPQSNDTGELVQVAIALVDKLYLPEVSYKKAGVFAYHLQSAERRQQQLFDKKTPKQRMRQEELMKAVDEINQRFGSFKIHIATIDERKKQWQVKKESMSPAYTTSWQQLPKVYA